MSTGIGSRNTGLHGLLDSLIPTLETRGAIAALDRLEKVLIPEYKEAGLVKDVIIMQSDLKDAVQIQQIRQMVDEGVDAIWMCCSSTTAMNDAVKYAYDKGVAVFHYSGYLTSPYAINALANYTMGGYEVAKSMCKQLGGKGNVLLVSGIPGAASSDTWDYGARKALEEFPDVKLVGAISGMWTDQIVQVEVQKWLATHPQKLDGIIIQSCGETGVSKPCSNRVDRWFPSVRVEKKAEHVTGENTRVGLTRGFTLGLPEMKWNLLLISCYVLLKDRDQK